MIRKGIYRHYKGKEYEVFGLAQHSETLEQLVVYKPLYDVTGDSFEEFWVRPISMFEEEVLIEGKSVPRFTFLSEKK